VINSRHLGNTELGVAVGPVDDGLGSNVSSRVRVGGCGVSALSTAKRVAFCPIGFLAVPTFGARSACVSRVYRDHADPSSSRLVGHELSELVERPIRQSGTLRLVGLNPFPDALQVFKGNHGTGAFSVSDQALGNLVVYILLISSLTPLKRTELSFCGTSPFALQIAAAVSIDAALSFYCFAAVAGAVAVHGDIHDTEINAENVGRLNHVGVVYVAHASDIEFPAHEHEINFTSSVFQQLALIVAGDARDLDAPADRPDRDGGIVQEPEDTVVVRLSSMLTEMPLNLGVGLIGVRYLGNAANRDLRGKPELIPYRRVGQLVERKLLERFRLPGEGGHEIARLIRPLNGLLEQFVLFGRRQQFHVGDKLHAFKYRKFNQDRQPERGKPRLGTLLCFENDPREKLVQRF